jgi:hypothetical protein
MGHASHQGNHGPVFDDHGGTYSRMGGGAASHISSNPAACPFLSNLPVPPKATAPWTAKHLQVWQHGHMCTGCQEGNGECESRVSPEIPDCRG